MHYGFLGLGIMGRAMAANLLAAGHELTVWNRDAAKCADLVAKGALQARAPKDVAAASDVTFAMLADPIASENVCLGFEGVLDGITPGKGYVDMSTIDPHTSWVLAQAVADQGGRYLEAPVSGSRKPAEEGTLVILAAGDKALYEEVAAAFTVMGKKSFYLGPVGQAAKMKLIVNMIMGGMMTAFSEGLGLAAACGLAPAELLEVLASGAVANPMFAGKGPLMARREFGVAFPLKHLEKDLRLALELGEDEGQWLPTAESARLLFAKAVEQGYGDEDFSAVYKAICD